MISANTEMLFLIFSIFGHINFVLSGFLKFLKIKQYRWTLIYKIEMYAFFTFNSKNDSTEISLDNPFEPKITAMTGKFQFFLTKKI